MERQGRLGFCRNILGKVEATPKTTSNWTILGFCKTRSSLLFDAGIEKPKVTPSCFTPGDFPQRKLKHHNRIEEELSILSIWRLTPLLSFGRGPLSLKRDGF